MLGQRGIKPENLPPAEDIKKVERRVASDEKKIEKTSNKLPKKVEYYRILTDEIKAFSEEKGINDKGTICSIKKHID